MAHVLLTYPDVYFTTEIQVMEGILVVIDGCLVGVGRDGRLEGVGRDGHLEGGGRLRWASVKCIQ